MTVVVLSGPLATASFADDPETHQDKPSELPEYPKTLSKISKHVPKHQKHFPTPEVTAVALLDTGTHAHDPT